MIKIPLEDIIFRIKEHTGMSEEDVNKKIDDKLHQLSGLISRQGAAHIVANELGINLFESLSGQLKIKNILSGMRSVETLGKVVNVFEPREFETKEGRKGKVASMTIGDDSGSIRVTLWGDLADNATTIKKDDIVKVSGGYVRENQGRKEIHMNDKSTLVINPEGETVGEVKTFSPGVRKKINDLNADEQNIELLATIVQVFEPRFFEVCPQCGKRARQHQDGFVCEEHQKVDPDYSYLMNVVLDDGSLPDGTIRTVFFRNQVDRLLDKTKEEILQYKDNVAAFETVKTQLLGNILKVVGRVSKNDMFDRLEFVAQLVFTNPDPAEEMKEMQPASAPVENPAPAENPSVDEQTTEETFVQDEVEKIN